MRSAFLLALAVCALLGSAGCRRAAAPAVVASSGPATVAVRVAAVEFSRESPVIRAPAVIVRQTQADLSFPVPGIVAQVLVRAGDHVKKDQELARLHTDPIEAQLLQAQTTLEKARRDLGRVEKLQADRVATLENLQDARTQVEQAAAALRIAEFNRRHAVITAPSDGVILRRLAEPNEQVTAARPVLTFAAEADWIARAGLTARDAVRIAPGATAVLQDAAGTSTPGKIVRIAEAVDPATLTVSAEAALETAPPGARSGLTASLLITPQSVAERPVVPVAALRDGQGGSASLLLVGADSRVKRMPVEVEQIDGERAFLRTPLPRDARIVIAGGQYVADGAAVTIADAKSGAAK